MATLRSVTWATAQSMVVYVEFGEEMEAHFKATCAGWMAIPPNGETTLFDSWLLDIKSNQPDPWKDTDVLAAVASLCRNGHGVSASVCCFVPSVSTCTDLTWRS